MNNEQARRRWEAERRRVRSDFSRRLRELDELALYVAALVEDAAGGEGAGD